MELVGIEPTNRQVGIRNHRQTVPNLLLSIIKNKCLLVSRWEAFLFSIFKYKKNIKLITTFTD